MMPKTSIEWGVIVGTLLLLISIIAGCSDPSTPKTGKDGYKFSTPEEKKEERTVRLVTYKTEKEFLDSLRKENKDAFDKNVAAYSVIVPSKNLCEIHIIEPQTEYIPEFMGHEAYHCFYGQFHKSNDSR